MVAIGILEKGKVISNTTRNQWVVAMTCFIDIFYGERILPFLLDKLIPPSS